MIVDLSVVELIENIVNMLSMMFNKPNIVIFLIFKNTDFILIFQKMILIYTDFYTDFSVDPFGSTGFCSKRQSCMRVACHLYDKLLAFCRLDYMF